MNRIDFYRSFYIKTSFGSPQRFWCIRILFYFIFLLHVLYRTKWNSKPFCCPQMMGKSREEVCFIVSHNLREKSIPKYIHVSMYV